MSSQPETPQKGKGKAGAENTREDSAAPLKGTPAKPHGSKDNFTTDKELLSGLLEYEKNRLIAILLSAQGTRDLKVDWAAAAERYGSASANSMQTGSSKLLKKIRIGSEEGGGTDSAASTPATAKSARSVVKRGRPAKASGDDVDDASDIDEDDAKNMDGDDGYGSPTPRPKKRQRKQTPAKAPRGAAAGKNKKAAGGGGKKNTVVTEGEQVAEEEKEDLEIAADKDGGSDEEYVEAGDDVEMEGVVKAEE